MIAAMEGREVDRIPIAPYFWGAEYVWKLMGKPIWEVMLGPPGNTLDLLTALEKRHGCDWLVPLHRGSGWLPGKRFLGEDSRRVFFRDESTGEEWIFHKEGHWLGRPGEKRPLSHSGRGFDPPRTLAEAEDWLAAHPGCSDVSPLVPNPLLRQRFPHRFLCGPMPAPFAGLGYALGFEATLLLLAEDPALCAYLAERLMGDVERQAAQLAADGFDAGLMCDSWASADILSPPLYRNWIAPLHRRVCEALHAAGLKAVIYNTGNVLPMLDTLAHLGYDALSLEERIKGVEMDIGEVRRAVGPDLCLFGNFDSYLLLAGDRRKIREEVARQIRGAGPRAFIMGTGSPICDGTDPDTVDYWIALVREGESGKWRMGEGK